jgi:hypothetical protein
MFDLFRRRFFKDQPVEFRPKRAIDFVTDLEEIVVDLFLEDFGCKSIEYGKFRILSKQSALEMRMTVAATFSCDPEQLRPFAVDWLNRCYCVQLAKEGGPGKVAIFEHFTDRVLDPDANFFEFIDGSLLEVWDVALESELFKKFCQRENISSIPDGKCASIMHPLFLGGELVCENLALIDCDVDWDLTDQLLQKTRHLPVGAQINGVSMVEKTGIVDSARLLYWRSFNFLTKRIMAPCFIIGGFVIFIYGVPNILPGGTVQLNGQPTDDMIIRLFSVLMPLIMSVSGVFLFRAKPYYPSSVTAIP